jgi:hypothetical protein
MQETETMQMPVLGEAGEHCAGCGAPLAADQRYCLNCGQRRVGPRVDYRTYLAGSDGNAQTSPREPQLPAATVEPPAEPEAGPAKAERDFAPLAAVAGIALLGLMLLIGVLIGRGGDSPDAAPPSVITVGGSGGGETATSAGASQEAAKTATAKPGKKGGGTKDGTGAKAVAGGLTGEAARQAEGTVEASKDDLEALEQTSGENYEDTMKKLPDKIATPGEPPPIDKTKAPGGGEGGTTIE